jgi:urease accessory protein
MGILRAILPGLVMMLPGVALAHTGLGTTATFAHGLLHPLLGLDHVLAMVAVGLWAAQLGGRALFALPAAFLTVMLLGGLLGMAGVALPAVEVMIAGSVLALGALIALGRPLPWSLAMAIVGGFALFHGFAHGAEMPGASGVALYGAGFLLASATLHGLGIGLGLMLERAATPRLVRHAGAVVLVGGLGLLL